MTSQSLSGGWKVRTKVGVDGLKFAAKLISTLDTSTSDDRFCKEKKCLKGGGGRVPQSLLQRVVKHGTIGCKHAGLGVVK
jgi:hypothetical protein